MEIKRTNRYLRLKGITDSKEEKVYTFEVYTIEGFDFKEDKLTCNDIKEEQPGLYMFSYRYPTHFGQTCGKQVLNYCHKLLYLGKAEKLQERPFNMRHNKFEDLGKTSCNSISIYQCSQSENPKDVESNILNHYNFQFNEQENEDTDGKSISEEEG
jgi:hypothetical protein